ncbi:MAG: hypothetical protein GF350_06470 [Chitinivibrionales bacterium]|nr:hypothetical protein [Chitinivibrionales bacterium]
MNSAKMIVFLLVLLVSWSARGSIRLYIAEKDSIETALGKSFDSLWYRAEAYESIIDGTVPYYDSTEIWIDSVYDIGVPGLLEPQNVFASEIPNDAGPRNNYFVAGVADSFVVPESGTYTFVIGANEGMFIMIDDQLLTGEPDSVFLYQTLDEARDPGLGIDGIPQVESYSVTTTLSEGPHEFRFYYWEKGSTSKASIQWVLPSSPSALMVIPPEVFGARKNYGPLEADWITVGPGPDDDICAYTIFEDTGTVYFGAVARGLMPAETAYYHWEFSIDEGFTGEPEITTTDTIFDTLLVRPPDKTGDVVVDYKFWFETSMGRSIDPIGGGSCHVVIFADTSTAIRHKISHIAMSDKANTKQEIFNLQGKRIRANNPEYTSNKINDSQVCILKNKNSITKHLLVK